MDLGLAPTDFIDDSIVERLLCSQVDALGQVVTHPLRTLRDGCRETGTEPLALVGAQLRQLRDIPGAGLP